MKIGLLGHGTIGGGVDRIIGGICGMEVKSVVSLEVDDSFRDRHVDSIDDIVNDPEIDTVVEVMGGVEPAFTFVSRCMQAGKNLVTANKALVAAHYRDLIRLSEEYGVSFRATASAGGSIPWLLNLERAKRADTILNLSGIMNGTTNFILSKMKNEGADFDAVLKEAQRLGFAEANPAADIDGPDIRKKLDISANVAFNVWIDEEKIDTFGIRNVTAADIRNAAALGRTLKLTGFSGKTEEGIYSYVEPVLLPETDVMAHIPANYNLIRYEGAYAGVQSYMGEGAGRFPTAYNVVEDLFDIQAGMKHFYTTEAAVCEPDNTIPVHRYYIRSTALLPELSELKEDAGKDYVITRPVSVSVMHDLMKKQLETDPGAFMAGIPE